MARFQKGQIGNPNGKPAGVKNKLPRDLVQRVLAIADQLEAEGKGLTACAQDDPPWFLENFVKPLLPKNVNLDVEGALQLEHTISEAIKVKLDDVYAVVRGS